MGYCHRVTSSERHRHARSGLVEPHFVHMIPFSEVVGSRSVPSLLGSSTGWELSTMKWRHLSFPQKTPTYFVTIQVVLITDSQNDTERNSSSVRGWQRLLLEPNAKPGPATTCLVLIKKHLRHVPARLQGLCRNVRSVLKDTTDGLSIRARHVADRHVIFVSPITSEISLQFERCPLQFRGRIQRITRPIQRCHFSVYPQRRKRK